MGREKAIMRRHGEFEWDPKKALANPKKHGVTFDDAAVVLGDDEADVYHVEEADDDHSVGKNRYVTFGSRPNDRRVVPRNSWVAPGSSHRPDWTRATRKPRSLSRYAGVNPSRYADRQYRGMLNQLPPRSTRDAAPSNGHTGSSTGDRA